VTVDSAARVPDGSSGSSRRARIATVLAAPVALPVIAVVLFGASGRDDAYITYWPAHTLAAFGQILNYNGARLEQSTSLLDTAVLAGLSKLLPVSLPTLGYVTALVCGVVAVVVAQRLGDRLDPRPPAIVTGALVASSPFFVYWAVGSMEATLVALSLLLLLTAIAGLLSGRRGGWAQAGLAASAFMYVAVRPEGAFIMLSAIGGTAVTLALFRSGRSPSPNLALLNGAAWIVASFVVVTAFRLVYFGEAFPNPVTAKTGGGRRATFDAGITYLRASLLHPWAILVAAVLVVAVARTVKRPSPLIVLLWMVLAATVAEVVVTGGDWMEGGRMLVPAVPVVALIVAFGLADRAYGRYLAAALVVVQLGATVSFARASSTGAPIWSTIAGPVPAASSSVATSVWAERRNRIHVRDVSFLPEVSAVVARLGANGGPVTIASHQAGLVMYYLDLRNYHRITFIDQESLTTDAFRRCSAGLPHSSEGEAMSFDYWFAHLATCRVPMPDVVFDLGTEPASIARYYTSVFQEPVVKIRDNTPVLVGTVVNGAQFLAVRNDLLPLLGDLHLPG
jgi:hypothetical protein